MAATGRTYLVFLLALAAVALGVRLLAAESAGLILDEILTFQVARSPVSEILAHGQTDPHPPGWYLLMAPLAKWTANSLVLRLPSILAAVLAIALVYRIAWRLAGLPVAVAACSLLAVSWPLWLADSQMRMYGLLTLLNVVALAAWLALRSEDSRWKQTVYWLVCLALPLVHFLGMTTLLGLALAPGRPRRRLWPPLVIGLALGVAWIALQPSGVRSDPPPLEFRGGAIGEIAALPAHLLGVTALLAWGPLRADPGLPAGAGNWLTSLVGLAGWVSAGWGLVRLRRLDGGAAGALAGLVFVPLMAVALGATLGLQIFQSRYFTPTAFALFICVVMAWPGRLRIALVAILVALNLATVARFPSDTYLWNQNWRPVAEFVREHETPGDVLVAYLPYALLGFNHYYAPGRFRADFSDPDEGMRLEYAPEYRGVAQVGLWNSTALTRGLGGYLRDKKVFLLLNQAGHSESRAVLDWFNHGYEVEAALTVPSYHQWGVIYVWKVRPRHRPNGS